MKQIKEWPKRSLVGYVAAYGSIVPSNVTNNMISEAITEGYTVFVYAFGSIDAKNIVSIPTGITEADLQQQNDDIHANNSLSLISFGGANNTFLPGMDSKLAASNTVEFCHLYGFDGLDLDLESVDVDASYLTSYIDEIRNIDDGIFITAAPQIAGGYGGPASFAPATIFTKDFLVAAKFSALFVQEYNQFGGAKFEGLVDTDVGFISASFGPLTEIVPFATKIVVGEPANEDAGSGLSNPVEIVKDIASQDVLENSQYGGIMVWAINYDSDQNWTFAKGVEPVV
ncbi:MAG: hypothetical protein HRT58_14660 [Crocinitomicaceae bacterium]|nr:glycosyl hydrolase family 18 protein [Flavobacteriales bacterium]NQZ36909.1 hypothetical protein [Crocinitomicaceae bacterium]